MYIHLHVEVLTHIHMHTHPCVHTYYMWHSILMTYYDHGQLVRSYTYTHILYHLRLVGAMFQVCGTRRQYCHDVWLGRVILRSVAPPHFTPPKYLLTPTHHLPESCVRRVLCSHICVCKCLVPFTTLWTRLQTDISTCVVSSLLLCVIREMLCYVTLCFNAAPS